MSSKEELSIKREVTQISDDVTEHRNHKNPEISVREELTSILFKQNKTIEYQNAYNE